MEKRQSIRLEKTMPIKFDLPDVPSQTRPFEALTRNIGEGGIFIETDLVQNENIALNKETALELEMGFLGEAQGIAPRGKIAWISRKSRTPRKKRNGFGVRFTRLLPQEKRAIALFISKERIAQSEFTTKEIPIISREEKLTDRQRRNLEILDNIRKNRLISRAEISKKTDINIVTVSNYIDSYLKKGLVFERGLDISTGGRRPELIEINPQYGYALGVDLNILNNTLSIRVAGCDFSARILSKTEGERKSADIEEGLDILKSLITEILRSKQVEREKIKGIGIGISGIMDRFSGSVRSVDTRTTFANYLTIKKELEEEFGLPVYVENAACCALFAEKWIGISLEVKAAENIIYILSDAQCAVMIKGELYTGTSSSAGQLNFVYPKGLPAESCSSSIGAELGVKIAYLVNIFNPQVVVMGAEFAPLGDNFLDSIRRTVNRCAFRENANIVRIIGASLGEEAAALGAASLVIEAAFANI